MGCFAGFIRRLEALVSSCLPQIAPPPGTPTADLYVPAVFPHLQASHWLLPQAPLNTMTATDSTGRFTSPAQHVYNGGEHTGIPMMMQQNTGGVSSGHAQYRPYSSFIPRQNAAAPVPAPMRRFILPPQRTAFIRALAPPRTVFDLALDLTYSQNNKVLHVIST
jgi:hypothetical protein